MATQIPNITIHNVETNELIERPMNADELAETKKLQEEIAQFDAWKAQQDAAKAAAKAAAEAKLAALGLTTEDLQALGLGGN